MARIDMVELPMTPTPKRLTPRIWTMAALTLVLAAPAALAAPPPGGVKPSRAGVLQGLLDCRSKTDNAERLACYDAAAAVMDQAEAKGDIVVVDREQSKAIRRQAFGFTLPSLSLFERGDKPEHIDQVSGVIAAARADANGKWVLRLEDGAVWRQIDGDAPHRDPKAGMPVEIKAATLGSYLLSVDGQRSYRAHRDQ
jgi:hypothetical protein